MHDNHTYKLSTVDLNKFIGNINGKLCWGHSNFVGSSRNIKLQGLRLVAECQTNDGKVWKESSLDLHHNLRNRNGCLEVIMQKCDEKMSVMLSEVPWMKFKVVAEPDVSILTSHPAVKQAMASIAETTVTHVATSMHSMINTAIEQAIVAVTASAIEHITTTMTVMMEATTAHAHVRNSHTHGLSLNMQEQLIKAMSAGLLNGNGLANGHGHANDHC